MHTRATATATGKMAVGSPAQQRCHLHFAHVPSTAADARAVARQRRYQAVVAGKSSLCVHRCVGGGFLLHVYAPLLPVLLSSWRDRRLRVQAKDGVS